MMRIANRMRSDAPIGSSLSESSGKSLAQHQIIHAVNQTRVANQPLVAVANRMLSSTGGLGKDIPIEPNQLLRRFVGNESPFLRRARVSAGIINSVHRIGK
tara:strand:+ start:579 stop:881 length:303 start_codon:yes stop_codon:yes gene_type:complete